MSQTNKKTLTIFSVLSLLNVFLLPIFEVFGGLFPDSQTSFLEVLEAVFDDGDAWEYRVVLFSMFIFLPSVFMLIAALSGSRGSFLLASGAGIGLWLYNMINLISDTDIEYVFDLESTPVSIGSWIAIVLFITAFSQASKDKPADYNYTPNSDNIYSSGVNSSSDIRFCPICGSVIEGETTFCGVCGSNL